MTTDIPYQWLRERGTPAQFEQAQLQRTAATFNLPFEKIQQKFASRPFGEMTDRWRMFVAQLTPEDELWNFSSPDETFPKKLGRKGFAIVRAGTIRDILITLET
jgi:hypothetical protein